ncbi:reductive dehalogenase [Candidatus Bathyarchaeota archaeon]|nr:reductive dehalogenase [Candidatus Bathyarchaeota archaeon]
MTRKTFDELYPSKPEFTRFDQRNTAFGQSIAKTGNVVEFGAEEYRSDKIKQKTPGFSLVEYAFNGAAGLYEYPKGSTDTQGIAYYDWQSLGYVTKPKDVPRWEGSPEKAARIITKVAKYFGACDVGFTRLDKRWFYTHSRYGIPLVFDDEIDEGYVTEEKAVFPTKQKYVIAIAIPMEYEEFMHAPTQLEVTTNMGYSRMHHMAGQLAEFIRGLGWHATPMGNDTAMSVPIAIQAGLGHAGRHGRLITWERGPLVRLMKVFTDLPLPQSELAHPGIIKFCEDCEKCAKHCPAQAIPHGPRTYEAVCKANNPGFLKWYGDEEACLAYWNEVGSACSVCFRTCSFTKGKGAIYDMVKWFIKYVPQLNKLWVWSDDIFGYGKPHDPEAYWNKPFKRT